MTEKNPHAALRPVAGAEMFQRALSELHGESVARKVTIELSTLHCEPRDLFRRVTDALWQAGEPATADVERTGGEILLAYVRRTYPETDGVFHRTLLLYALGCPWPLAADIADER